MERSFQAGSAVPGLSRRLILALLSALAPLAAHAAALTSMPPSSGWLQWYGNDGWGNPQPQGCSQLCCVEDCGQDCFVAASSQRTSLGLLQTAAAESVDCAGTTYPYTTAMMSLQS
jgi:hypothetical protein